MILSQSDTKKFIDIVLESSCADCRRKLHECMITAGWNEGIFYSAVVAHSKTLQLTTDQWFELLSRLSNRVLRSQLNLESLLSDEQIKNLPPNTG